MLEQYSYCPILHTRTSEMRALLQLPSLTKDLMLPLLVARPWPNAARLQTTWDKISEALGERRFGLDLDVWKLGSAGREPAASEFDSLFLASNGYERYYDLISSLPRAVPVLQGSDLNGQAAHVIQIDRGAILRLQHDRIINPAYLIEQAASEIDDLVFVVDVGWTRDIIGRELWASSAIERILSFRAEAEIVFSGSSFPDEFSTIRARAARPLSERLIYQNLVRRHNEARLVYGDWGSTRSPTDPTPMRSVPRLDLPMTGEWLHFRRDPDDDEEEDFRDIAIRVVEDPAWNNQPNIWGIYAISSTAENLPGAIRSPALAASARINIHLHKQAFYGSGVSVDDGDEPFIDD